MFANRNLGSSTYRLVNKVASTYSFYQNPGRYEYMWTSPYFYGWQLDHTTHANGYGEILRPLGFSVAGRRVAFSGLDPRQRVSPAPRVTRRDAQPP